MRKDLPYFKFNVAEWLTGDIVYEEFDVQGLFVNICAIYWQRKGKLSIQDINKRFKNPIQLKELTDRFISITDGFISINFLDEQFQDRDMLSNINSKNGKKGGRPKALKTEDEKPTANQSLTESEANESNIEKRREEKNIYKTYLNYLNEKLKRDYRGSKKTEAQFNARVKEGYTIENFKKAIDNAYGDSYHKTEGYKHITPEFLTRADKLDKFINATNNTQKSTVTYHSGLPPN